MKCDSYKNYDKQKKRLLGQGMLELERSHIAKYNSPCRYIFMSIKSIYNFSGVKMSRKIVLKKSTIRIGNCTR